LKQQLGELIRSLCEVWRETWAIVSSRYQDNLFKIFGLDFGSESVSRLRDRMINGILKVVNDWGVGALAVSFIPSKLSPLTSNSISREACSPLCFIVSKHPPFSLVVESNGRVTSATSGLPPCKTYMQLGRLTFRIEEVVVE
jgi:hypothetical protein